MQKVTVFLLVAISSLLVLAAAHHFWARAQSASSQTVKTIALGNQPTEEEEHRRPDKPDEAMRHEFAMTRDPFINRIPRERLAVAQQNIANYYNNTQQNSTAPAPPFFGAAAPATANYPMNWTELGPNNVGGRTRALWADLYYTDRIFAGGVGGGLWKINNISTSQTWAKVGGNFDNMAVTAFAQNPTNKQHMYMGTGEGWYNFDAIQGGGIYKSSNYGSTWTLLGATVPGNSTNGTSSFQNPPFDWKYINKIVVAANGDVYVATQNDGILRSSFSTDPTHINWVQVLGDGVSGTAASDHLGMDIEIGADGAIYASVGSVSPSLSGNLYKSTTGNVGSWTKLSIAGSGLPVGSMYRIEIAASPNTTTSGTVYISAANNFGTAFSPGCGAGGGIGAAGIFKTTNGGTTWTQCANPFDADPCIANEFTRRQAWYDLSLAVTLDGSVYAGGISLFKSTNGGNSWTQISDWQGSTYNGVTYQNVHADQHNIVAKPGTSGTIYWANDGGVYRSTNATSAVPTITALNTNYNVTQFYSAAIRNDLSSFQTIGGTPGQWHTKGNNSCFGFG